MGKSCYYYDDLLSDLFYPIFSFNTIQVHVLYITQLLPVHDYKLTFY